MKKRALEELKKIFPRQVSDEFTEVFSTIALRELRKKYGKGERTVVYGNRREGVPFYIFSPNGDLRSERVFDGRDYSFSVSKALNEQYGFIVVAEELYFQAASALAKEVVRALVKNSIFVLANYNFMNTEGDFTGDGFRWPSKDEFYSRLFDPCLVFKAMRLSAKRKISYDGRKGRSMGRKIEMLSPDEVGFWVREVCIRHHLPRLVEVMDNLPRVVESSKHKNAFCDPFVFFLRVFFVRSGVFYRSLDRVVGS